MKPYVEFRARLGGFYHVSAKDGNCAGSLTRPRVPSHRFFVGYFQERSHWLKLQGFVILCRVEGSPCIV